jgi:hypothetical protein
LDCSVIKQIRSSPIIALATVSGVSIFMFNAVVQGKVCQLVFYQFCTKSHCFHHQNDLVHYFLPHLYLFLVNTKELVHDHMPELIAVTLLSLVPISHSSSDTSEQVSAYNSPMQSDVRY